MLPHRKLLLATAIVLVGGSLSLTAGYGLHLRSDAYRVDMERGLSNFFSLPCDIGAIRGRSFSSRSFENVSVWLPSRRDRIFSCARAIWSELTDAGRQTNALELADGVLVLGSDRWVTGDYRQVFESGLGHDFEDLHLSTVQMRNFEIAFARSGFSLRCRDTSGAIDMSNPHDGVARLHAYELNGHRIIEGVQIHARFLPKKGVQVTDLALSVPRVPLSFVGLDNAIGGPITQGNFEGSIQYLSQRGRPVYFLRGNLDDVNLAELTRRLPIGPLSGRISVDVQQARFEDQMITQLIAHGAIDDLTMTWLGPILGVKKLSGTSSLNLDAADLALDHIHRLKLSGLVQDVGLAEWVGLLGRGGATGSLTLRINNVDVVDDAIKSADIELRAVPPTKGPGTIDRELLLSLAETALDFKWPPALPQQLLPPHVEYAELGMRLLVHDNRLRILGTHGPRGKTILTLRIFGQTFPVLEEQPGSIDLTPYWSGLRERVRDYGRGKMQQWLKRRSTTQPSNASSPLS